MAETVPLPVTLHCAPVVTHPQQGPRSENSTSGDPGIPTLVPHWIKLSSTTTGTHAVASSTGGYGYISDMPISPMVTDPTHFGSVRGMVICAKPSLCYWRFSNSSVEVKHPPNNHSFEHITYAQESKVSLEWYSQQQETQVTASLDFPLLCTLQLQRAVKRYFAHLLQIYVQSFFIPCFNYQLRWNATMYTS